jgi:hypothetical protein
MKKHDLPTTTYYSSKCFSRDWLAYMILAITALIIVGVVLDSVLMED